MLKMKMKIIVLVVIFSVIISQETIADDSISSNDQKIIIPEVEKPLNKTETIFKIPIEDSRSLMLRSLDSRHSIGTMYFRSGSDLLKQSNSDITNKINSFILLNWNDEKIKDYRVSYFYDIEPVPECISFPMRLSGVPRTNSMMEANLIWSSPKVDQISNLIRELNKYQRYNHFPTTWELWRKDRLWKNFKRMKEKFPSDYNYMSDSFVFPKENILFNKTLESDHTSLWLKKPKFSSFGKGIEFVDINSSIPKNSIVTRYIANPHLINNKKYDIRIYMLVTGFSPLKIYLFPEGLVKFATEEYNTREENRKNTFIHLTNRNLNKYSDKYDSDNINASDEPIGSIWSIGALRKYLKNKKIKFEKTWKKIKDIAVKTIISIADKTREDLKKLTKERNNLFELYGLDILLDETLNPWLLEVNSKTSLDVITHLDLKIKSAFMAAIFNTIGIVPYSYSDQDKKDPKALFAEKM